MALFDTVQRLRYQDARYATTEYDNPKGCYSRNARRLAQRLLVPVLCESGIRIGASAVAVFGNLVVRSDAFTVAQKVNRTAAKSFPCTIERTHSLYGAIPTGG